jgi:PEP-CTERM/exosortase A-associated glycosyltransferase
VHILHVFDHSIPLHSGYTFRSRAILEQQRARGWRTSHVTSPKHYGTDALEEDVDGFHFFRTPRVNGVVAKLPALDPIATTTALGQRLQAVARAVRPDILHAHSPALNGLAALRVARRLGIPLVYEVRAFWEDAAVDHGSCREGDLRYRLTRALETYVLRRANAVTTICEGLRREIIGRGLPQERVTVIPNAVDLERFAVGGEADAELSRALGLEGKPVLGFIGSFYAYEGLPLLLQALPRVLAHVPDVRVLLVGGGRGEERLRREAADLGVTASVTFAGRVPHDQVPRYYDLVTVFVYPRLPMRLTEIVTPLKPLEAMARGRLVVASDVGGHRELIRHGENGLLFAAGDAGALADTVIGLLEQRDRWQTQRAAARAYVERERSWPVSVARYAPVYEALVTRAGRLEART